MGWRGPTYDGEFPSLGWGVVDWLEAHFKVPAGELAGQDLRLTDDQVRFFVRLYAMTPDGRRVYRRASRRGAKGRGKSPEGAMFLAAEFAGPVVFDGWDDHGEPVGVVRHNPLCWAAATAEEQTDNVYAALREMLADAELPGVDVGKTRIEFTDGRPGKIESVTASAGAREGAPTTAVVLDETHLWFPSKGGDKLARVIRRNLGKTGGTSLEVTNAPAIGERSVAETTLEAAGKGQRGLLYDSVEAAWDDQLDPKDPAQRDEVMRALGEAYAGVSIGEGGWVDLDRQYEECMDVDTPREDVLRFYFNLARKASNRAFDLKRFDELAAPERRVSSDEPCLLMFDGARTRDCAVLTAWALGDDDTPAHHFGVQIWERPHNPDADYEHPRGEIRGAVRDFIDVHRCVLFVYDSSFHELSSLYDEWTDAYGEAADGGLVDGYPTASGKRMEAAVKRIREDMREGSFTHDGDPLVREHVSNAVAARNRGGWLMLEKEKPALKIDAAVTMTFGWDMVPVARELAARPAMPAGAMFVGIS
jgi:hypothetical protein